MSFFAINCFQDLLSFSLLITVGIYCAFYVFVRRISTSYHKSSSSYTLVFCELIAKLFVMKCTDKIIFVIRLQKYKQNDFCVRFKNNNNNHNAFKSLNILASYSRIISKFSSFDVHA